MEGFILFQSRNLQFRQIDPYSDDLSNYLSWLRDPDSNPFIQGTDRDFRLETLINYIKIKNASKNCVLWGIYMRQDLRHIGNIKFEPIQLDKDSVWVGILIGELESRGKGFGSEALSTAINYFSEVRGIRNFNLGVDQRNLPAVKLYGSQGFHLDKEKSLSLGKTIMSKVLKT